MSPGKVARKRLKREWAVGVVMLMSNVMIG